MSHVLGSLRAHTLTYSAPPLTRRAAVRQQTAAQPPAATQSPAVTQTSAATQTSAIAPKTPDFRDLFTAKTSPAAPEPPAQKPAPTAESAFGPNPWMSNPTGIGPNGLPYSYNPFYFATPQTAAKVAQMVGGTVVESNQFTPSNGGGFAQQQPNYMVRLGDGRLINPGLVASFYTHGYSQSYVEQMVAAEARNA